MQPLQGLFSMDAVNVFRLLVMAFLRDYVILQGIPELRQLLAYTTADVVDYAASM
jgi:hypothetical protein